MLPASTPDTTARNSRHVGAKQPLCWTKSHALFCALDALYLLPVIRTARQQSVGSRRPPALSPFPWHRDFHDAIADRPDYGMVACGHDRPHRRPLRPLDIPLRVPSRRTCATSATILQRPQSVCSFAAPTRCSNSDVVQSMESMCGSRSKVRPACEIGNTPLPSRTALASLDSRGRATHTNAVAYPFLRNSEIHPTRNIRFQNSQNSGQHRSRPRR